MNSDTSCDACSCVPKFVAIANPALMAEVHVAPPLMDITTTHDS